MYAYVCIYAHIYVYVSIYVCINVYISVGSGKNPQIEGQRFPPHLRSHLPSSRGAVCPFRSLIYIHIHIYSRHIDTCVCAYEFVCVCGGGEHRVLLQ